MEEYKLENEEKKKRKKMSVAIIIVTVILAITIIGAVITAVVLLNTQKSIEPQEMTNTCEEIDNNNSSNSIWGEMTSVKKKPVIYLYPEKEEEIEVKVGYPERFTCVYPEYNDGWKITALPDGTLKDDKREYYSLYYESENTKKYNGDLKEGFVIESKDIVKFLEEKLAILGLNDKESEEFIIYWLPQLQSNKYIYIRFQTMEEIEENMPLYISKTPDTIIRIMMEWKGLDEKIEVKEQELQEVNRNGFTVVEWGGTELQ